MIGDLHLHSHHSDGLLGPSEVVQRASSIGLKVLSLTDHDSREGRQEMSDHCQAAGVRWVPGIELSTAHADQEIHLLGYFPSDSGTPVLNEHLTRFQQRRRKRVEDILRQLEENGIPWNAQQVLKGITCRSPGRPHVARALVEHSLASNVGQAFRRFLKKGAQGWVPSTYPATMEMIRLIHAERGLAVMAHPGLGIPNEVLVDLASQGLDGVEAFHSSHKPSLVKKYLHLADQLGLMVTGGSDCHGPMPGGMRMGKTRLESPFLERFLERLT